jgi:hypothetical protein
MIPKAFITEWRDQAPWSQDAWVEQDLRWKTLHVQTPHRGRKRGRQCAHRSRLLACAHQGYAEFLAAVLAPGAVVRCGSPRPLRGHLAFLRIAEHHTHVALLSGGRLGRDLLAYH